LKKQGMSLTGGGGESRRISTRAHLERAHTGEGEKKERARKRRRGKKVTELSGGKSWVPWED